MNIVAPDADCALAPNGGVDVSGNSGVMYATQAGGSKMKGVVQDPFMSAYLSLHLGKGKRMTGGSKIPYAFGKEMKHLYGQFNNYSIMESPISRAATSWRGGGTMAYRKRLAENLNKLKKMESNKSFDISKLRDIGVPVSVLSRGYTHYGGGLPLEYFGGSTDNYNEGNSQGNANLTPHQGGGGVGMPLEYFGGSTDNYNESNSQGELKLTPHQGGGGVGMPLEYFGGSTDNYNESNSQGELKLTPHQAGGRKRVSRNRRKIPLLDDPVMGGILKTLGIFTLPANLLIPFSVLVFVYEKFISQKYADEPSITDDRIVDALLKTKGALTLHPLLSTAISAI